MLIGFFLGRFLSRQRNPMINNLMILRPNTQLIAYMPAASGAGYLQKTVDKGWIESCSLSLSPISMAIITQYTPTIVLGITIMFIWFYS